MYTTKKQEIYLDDCLWSAISIENWCISMIRHHFDGYIHLRFMKPEQIRAVLSKMKKGHSKRCGIPSRLMTDCIGHIVEGMKRHGNINKLKFKTVRKKKSFYFNGDIKTDKKGRLKLPGCKTTFKMSEMNKFHGKLKKVTLIKDIDGWVAVCVYDQDRPRIKPTDNKENGIDPGLKDSIVLSDGTKYNFPKFYRENEELISKLQRKSKGSKKLKRVQRKHKRQRRDHHHKLTTKMTREHKALYWSDDNFANLKQMKNLGKSYGDAGLGAFRDMLGTKLAAREGGVFVRVSNKFSTQTCSACGLRNPDASKLAVREWRCQSCGTQHDRDVNAAINTLLSGRGASADLGKTVSPQLSP